MLNGVFWQHWLRKAGAERDDVMAVCVSDINLTIKQGSVTALVGSSGGGKSTIVGLIEVRVRGRGSMCMCLKSASLRRSQRFYDVTAGAVEVDGVDVRKLDGTALRRQIALVSQEPVLFSGYARGWPHSSLRAVVAVHACSRGCAVRLAGRFSKTSALVRRMRPWTPS